MSATCRRHVADKAKCRLFSSRQANLGDTICSVSAHCCVAICRHLRTKDRRQLDTTGPARSAFYTPRGTTTNKKIGVRNTSATTDSSVRDAIIKAPDACVPTRSKHQQRKPQRVHACGRAGMAESPRDQRAARRRRNETTAGLSESTPPRHVATASGIVQGQSFTLFGSVSTLTTGTTIPTAGMVHAYVGQIVLKRNIRLNFQ